MLAEIDLESFPPFSLAPKTKVTRHMKGNVRVLGGEV